MYEGDSFSELLSHLQILRLTFVVDFYFQHYNSPQFWWHTCYNVLFLNVIDGCVYGGKDHNHGMIILWGGSHCWWLWSRKPPWWLWWSHINEVEQSHKVTEVPVCLGSSTRSKLQHQHYLQTRSSVFARWWLAANHSRGRVNHFRHTSFLRGWSTINAVAIVTTAWSWNNVPISTLHM